MKLTNERLLIVWGLGYLLISTSYFLVYLANYDSMVFEGLSKELSNVGVLKIRKAQNFDPSLIIAIGVFWLIMFCVSVVLWNSNNKKRLSALLKDETIGFGIFPFLIALGYHFAYELSAIFLLVITGIYALITIYIYFLDREV